MIRTAFALITNEQGEILLIQEGFKPAYGTWCLPGGHVDAGESQENATKREVREETGGLETEIQHLIFTKTVSNQEYQGRPEEDGQKIEINIFQAKAVAGNIDPGKLTEELDVRWFQPKAASALPLRWAWLKDLF